MVRTIEAKEWASNNFQGEGGADQIGMRAADRWFEKRAK
jgi:hypothetical protein